MTRWEYHYEDITDTNGVNPHRLELLKVPLIRDRLNELGAEGWELVGYDRHQGTYAAVLQCVFKRPVQGS